jgi:hypothetical protein
MHITETPIFTEICTHEIFFPETGTKNIPTTSEMYGLKQEQVNIIIIY